MADIKNFGIKGLAADVQMGKSGGRLKYDSANGRFDLTQSDGTTLEDLRVGTLTSGTWNGSIIGAAYGGTGQDFSSSTGVQKWTGGVASVGNIDLANTSFVSGILPLTNGGTGAGDAANARINLGLGNLATQAANNVAITGGAINGTVIGASSAANVTGTWIEATSGFIGNITGGAAFLTTTTYFSASGDASASAVAYQGNANVDLSLTLANTAVTAGTYGSATNIPQFTVDSKGRITAASNISIATTLNVAGDSGTDGIDLLTDTLNVLGGVGLTSAVTANTVTVNLDNTAVTAGVYGSSTDINGRYFCAVPYGDDATEANVIFCYDYRRSSVSEGIYRWSLLTFDSFIEIAALFTIQGQAYATDTGGNIYKLNDSEAIYTDADANNNKVAINAVVKTAAIGGQEIGTEKEFREITFLLTNIYEDFDLNVDLIANGKFIAEDIDGSPYRPIHIELPVGTLLYDTPGLLYDDFNLYDSGGTDQRVVTLVNRGGRANSIQWQFSTNAKGISWGLGSISIEADAVELANESGKNNAGII